MQTKCRNLADPRGTITFVTPPVPKVHFGLDGQSFTGASVASQQRAPSENGAGGGMVRPAEQTAR